MKYKRKTPCGVCGKAVFIDTVTKKVTCDCGEYGPITIPSEYILKAEFEAVT